MPCHRDCVNSWRMYSVHAPDVHAPWSPLVENTARRRRAATQVSRLLAQTMVALVCVAIAVARPASGSQDIIFNYIGAMTSVDGSIFAATTSLYSGVGGVQPDNTVTYGSRVFLQNLSDIQQSILSQSTAFRTDTLSETFLALVAVYLDSIGQLPCGLDLPLTPTVLPPFFSGATFLTNPNFPTYPITLRHLLEHTSSITELGFLDYVVSTPVAEALMTNDAFVATLFDRFGNDLFSTTARPGLPTSFNYSRTNTALATFIVNNQLALMQQNEGVAEADVVDVAGYLYNVMFPRVGMPGTFLLNRFGARSNPTYPAGVTADSLSYIAMQDVSSDGTAIVSAREVHPAYMSDFMFYTNTADLTSFLAAVLTPGGIFYNSIGARLASQSVSIENTAVPYVTYRGLGVFNMSINALCEAMTAVAGGNWSPTCRYDETNSPDDSAAYGIFTSGAFNQVALLCIPTASGQPWCSASAVHYFQNASNTLPERLLAPSLGGAAAAETTFYNWALLLSVANLADFTSLPPPTLPPVTRPPNVEPSRKNFGLWVFLGVLAVVVLVVAASYVADYFIQPAPPAKIVVPVPVVPTGAVSAGFNGGAGPSGPGGLFDPTAPTRRDEDYLPPPPLLTAGPGGRATDAVSPSAFQRSDLYGTRLTLDEEEDEDADTTTATTTTTTTRSTGATTSSLSTGTGSSPGTSPDGVRRRRKKFQPPQDSMTERGSSSNSPSGGGHDRSTSNSQRPSRGGGGESSREIPRFDAYI